MSSLSSSARSDSVKEGKNALSSLDVGKLTGLLRFLGWPATVRLLGCLGEHAEMLADLLQSRDLVVQLESGLLDFPCVGAAAFAVLVLCDFGNGPRRAFGKLRPVEKDLAP